jgi:hypothetical protein
VPIARYFMVVGSALAVLLLVAGWSLPEHPESFPDRPEVFDRATIRIRSARKWPEKVVLDTNQPTIPLLSIEAAPAQLVESLPEGMPNQTHADSLARSNSDAPPIDDRRPPARAKRRTARALPSTRVSRARNRNKPPTLGTSEECCRSEWADKPAMSKAAPRKRVARRDVWIGWHFPEAN